MPKSVMVHSFAEVPRAEIPRSSFDRSHGLKTTFDADRLIPILLDDIIPGDTFNVNCTFVARLASPTILPLMDNMYLETFFFFVPYRLVWDNWEKFMGAQHDPADTIAYTIPILGDATNIIEGDLGDYFGLPINFDPVDFVSCSALPFRAFIMIYNEWFRDENLNDSVDFATDNGPDGASQAFYDAPPFVRNKRHDYFTSCLPWPQKQTSAIPLLSDVLPTRYTGSIAGDVAIWSVGEAAYQKIDADAALANVSTTTGAVATSLWTDLGEAGFSINTLRLAAATQQLLERDARGGTRYVETLLAHYGVTSPDFRLQRPEFLGGGSSRIMVSPVAQTTYQGTQTLEDGKGALAGIGTVSGSHSWTKTFVEHGCVIGIANVRADITYSQGIDRYWDKSTRYDFYYPVLAEIGEQGVLNREIWFTNTASIDNAVFGYQERYAEYRYKPSRLTGLMRPDATGTLAAFHLSEDFAALPTLSSSFIGSNTRVPLDRALSVPAQPQFVADFYFAMKCARPMPLYGIPGNSGRF